ncbi:hypothetical protein CAEBREN_08609 [Caenorhabditis brenneri]|uniref:Uncharacterized protein n=1 Tax=Caenorhabditis brenneri TaxID=135651 RepID=G0N7W0_CAEBE|nr:hypothetical protein CAEBREN_08609 [Caenorhabditis brenneri]
MIVPIFLLLLNVSYLSVSVGMAVGVRSTPTWIGQDSKPAAPFTEIQFEGVFTCPLNRTFCITGYIEEEDSWSSNEYMYRFPFYCTNKVSLPHNIRVNFTGGDGFYDLLLSILRTNFKQYWLQPPVLGGLCGHRKKMGTIRFRLDL